MCLLQSSSWFANPANRLINPKATFVALWIVGCPGEIGAKNMIIQLKKSMTIQAVF